MPTDTTPPTTADTRTPLDVAAGIVVRADGAVLLGQRPPGKPYAGWWEFPGGKIEPGETIAQGLARELHEELGITVVACLPWIAREHSYPHARVRLHFRRVLDWYGEPQPREGQALAWCHPGNVTLEPLLPATAPLLAMLAQPARAGAQFGGRPVPSAPSSSPGSGSSGPAIRY